MMLKTLAVTGAFGAIIDVLLHFLQLIRPTAVPQRAVAILTLLSCLMVGVSLTVAFNLGAAIMMAAVGAMALYALVTKTEMP